jgi:hypothetical protein
MVTDLYQEHLADLTSGMKRFLEARTETASDLKAARDSGISYASVKVWKNQEAFRLVYGRIIEAPPAGVTLFLIPRLFNLADASLQALEAYLRDDVEEGKSVKEVREKAKLALEFLREMKGALHLESRRSLKPESALDGDGLSITDAELRSITSEAGERLRKKPLAINGDSTDEPNAG